jgi:hypothetical protein
MRRATIRATETEATTSEAAIFSRVFTNGKHALTPRLARYLLGLTFSDEDKIRMHELAVKNQEGALAAAEHEELHNYIKVGHLLAILQSKARQARK